MAQIPIKLYRTNAKKPLQVIFTSSQTYTIPSGYKSMDVFLVGGGGNGSWGQSGYSSDQYSHRMNNGSGGGGGGYTQTFRQLDITNRTITINVGGSNAKTNIIYNGSETKEANNGQNGLSAAARGGNGGSGGGSYGLIYESPSYGSSQQPSNGGTNGSSVGNGGGTGQGRTTKAFEEINGTVYSGGGGGGGSRYGDLSTTTVAQGGAGGGGKGGTWYPSQQNGANGAANTGGGGGGGAGSCSPNTTTLYGSGGSGIVIVRLYKNNKRPTDIDWSDKTINL